MNREQLIRELEELDLPEAELSGHRQRLKMALLDSGCWNKKTSMSIMKRFAPAGVLATIALAAMIVNFSGSFPSVSAQELAKKSYQIVSELPAERQADLRRLFGDDVIDKLQNAGKAEDLKLRTFDELAKEGNLPAYSSACSGILAAEFAASPECSDTSNL
jgi:predicted metal-dependent hydrolase